MGYRSDVAYKITFHNKDQWNVFLIEAKSKPETRLCFEDECLTVVHNEQELRFHAEGVKWYSDYEDVKCHLNLFELCDEYLERQEKNFVDGESRSSTPPVVSYLFKRVGESEDDAEELSGGDPDWGWIELIRYIRVDWQA